MLSVFWLFFGVPMTPEVEKITPWGPGAAPGNPPLGGLKFTYASPAKNSTNLRIPGDDEHPKEVRKNYFEVKNLRKA